MYEEASPYRGTISGRLTFSGSGTEITGWQAQADLSADNLRYLDRDVPELTLSLSLKQDHADLMLANGENRVSVNTTIAGTKLDGRFEATIPKLERLGGLVNQPELEGSFSGSGTLSGTIDNPTVDAQLAAGQVAYRNVPIDTIDGAFHFEDSSLTIDRAEISGRWSETDSLGSPWGIDSLGGIVEYSGQVSGNLDSISGTLTTYWSQPRYGSYAADSLSLRAEINGPELTLHRIELRRDDLMLDLSGAYDTTDATGSLKATLLQGGEGQSPQPAGTMQADFTIGPGDSLSARAEGQDFEIGLLRKLVEMDSTITGKLSFNATFKGSLQEPAANMQMSVRAMKLPESALDSITAAIDLNPRRLAVDSLHVYAANQQLSLTGQVELKRTNDGGLTVDSTSSFTADIKAEDFDLAAVSPFVLSDGDLAGRINAALRAHGNLDEPHITGSIDLSDGRVSLGVQAAPLEQINVHATLADSVLTIDSSRAIASDIPLRVHGTLTSHQMERLGLDITVTLADIGDLAAQGDVSREALNISLTAHNFGLAAFQPFLPSVDSLDGTFSADVDLQGTPDQPQVNGSVSLRNLTVDAPAFFTRVNNGAASVTFDRTRVIVDSLVASLNGGSIRLKGYVEHDLLTPTDIEMTLKADSVKFEDPEMYVVNVNKADLNYGKKDGQYTLGGDIELGEARLTMGFRPQSILPWAKSVETTQWEPPDMVARTRLDVRIRESNKLWVDNNLAHIRMRAEIGVIGTPVQPNLTGMVQIEEGYLLYLDRKFKVTQGTMFFTDPVKINPQVTLVASTEVTTYQRTASTKYQITFRAEGPLDQLNIDLTSQPPLEKSDIVSLLTLGATRAELTGSGSGQGGQGLTGALVQRAAGLTSERVAGYLSSKVGSMFGFSEFTVQGNLFNINGSSGPQLTASKQLSSRVELTYSTTVGHLNDQNIRLGYRLTPHLSLQGETDRFGRSGLDLKYGVKFK
jgi:autotransporter translocation and assembly factor TamB